MAVTHIGTEFTHNNPGSNNSGSQDVPVPSGTQEGDLMFLTSYGSTAGISVEGSWTLLDSYTHTDGTTKVEVRYRIASSEPSTYNVDSSNNTRGSAISVFRGHEPSGYINDWGVNDYRSFDGNPLSAPNLTTTKDGCKVFSIIVARGDDTTEEHYSSSDTELADFGQDNGSTTRTCGLFFSDAKDSGSVSGLDISHTGSGTHFILFSIAITPADDWATNESDTVTLGDSVSATLSRTLNFEDTCTLNDVPTDQSVTRTGTVTNRVRLSDTVETDLVEALNYEEDVSDTETLADTANTQASFSRSQNDTVGLSDATSIVRTLVISDTLTLVDTSSTQVDKVASYSDTLTLTDSVTSTSGLQKVLSDEVSLSDSVSMVRSVVLDVSDTETLDDGTPGIAHDFIGNASDRETLSDSASTELTTGGPLTHNTTDTETLADGATTQASFSRSQSDTVELSDSTSVTRTLVVSDAVTLTDTTSNLAGKFTSLSDTVTLADTATKVSAFQRSQSDTETLSDSVSSTGSYVRSFSDAITLSDSYTAGSNEPPEPDDLLTLSDSVSITHIGPDTSGEIGNYATTLVVGPASIYVADFGTTEPQGLEILSEPSGDWVDIGGTLDGVELSVTQEYEESEFVQIPDQPVRRLKKRALTAKTVLAEPTLQNILYGLNGGVLDSGSGYESYTPDPSLDEATELDYRAVMLYGWAPGEGTDGGHKRRVVVMRKCLSIDNVELAYKKEDQSGLAVTWAVHRVDGSTAPFLIIDEE